MTNQLDAARARLEKAQNEMVKRKFDRDSDAFALWMRVCEWLDPNPDVPPDAEWLNDPDVAEGLADEVDEILDDLPMDERFA